MNWPSHWQHVLATKQTDRMPNGKISALVSIRRRKEKGRTSQLNSPEDPRNAVPRPTETDCVKVNHDNCKISSSVSCFMPTECARHLCVDPQIHHADEGPHRADQQRASPAYSINDKTDKYECSNNLDDAVDPCRKQAGTGSGETDGRKNRRTVIVDGIGAHLLCLFLASFSARSAKVPTLTKFCRIIMVIPRRSLVRFADILSSRRTPRRPRLCPERFCSSCSSWSSTV